jgi:hypothetical protein
MARVCALVGLSCAGCRSRRTAGIEAEIKNLPMVVEAVFQKTACLVIKRRADYFAASRRFSKP